MKHARSDYNRIQDPAGLIPADEPVFLLRGQDGAAPAAVAAWADCAAMLGASPEMVAMAREHAANMVLWQRQLRAAAGPHSASRTSGRRALNALAADMTVTRGKVPDLSVADKASPRDPLLLVTEIWEERVRIDKKLVLLCDADPEEISRAQERLLTEVDYARANSKRYWRVDDFLRGAQAEAEGALKSLATFFGVPDDSRNLPTAATETSPRRAPRFRPGAFRVDRAVADELDEQGIELPAHMVSADGATSWDTAEGDVASQDQLLELSRILFEIAAARAAGAIRSGRRWSGTMTVAGRQVPPALCGNVIKCWQKDGSFELVMRVEALAAEELDRLWLEHDAAWRAQRLRLTDMQAAVQTAESTPAVSRSEGVPESFLVAVPDSRTESLRGTARAGGERRFCAWRRDVADTERRYIEVSADSLDDFLSLAKQALKSDLIDFEELA